MKFKRYEYVIKGSIEWCEEDAVGSPKEDWDEFKEDINDDGFYD